MNPLAAEDGTSTVTSDRPPIRGDTLGGMMRVAMDTREIQQLLSQILFHRDKEVKINYLPPPISVALVRLTKNCPPVSRKASSEIGTENSRRIRPP